MTLKKRDLLYVISIITLIVIMTILFSNKVVYSSLSMNVRPSINITNSSLLTRFSYLKQYSSSNKPVSQILTSAITQGPKTSKLSSVKSVSSPIKKYSHINLDSPNVLQLTKTANNFEKATMKVFSKSITIFIYGRIDFVSRAILEDGSWEDEFVHQLLFYLRRFNFKVNFLDIGCNIGVYTLAVASFGYKVIAVDANKNNTDRLMKAIIENHLEHKISLILNAISNTRANFSMNTVNENVGSQRIISDKNAKYQVRSILMDDLLLVTEADKAIVIKIDIEGSEIGLFEKASNLFAKRNVVAVMMEWLIVRYNKNCINIISFFNTANYRPYPNFLTENELDRVTYLSWPGEIVWKKMMV